MSWASGMFDFKEKTSIKDIQEELYDAFENERGAQEPVHQSLKLLDNLSIFDSREEAENYINNHSEEFYRRFNVGVKYKNYDNIKPTKNMQNLERRISETEKKMKDYEKAHSVSTFKAEFVGCPDCKSKLKRDLLKSEKCPVCGTDMRSNTTITTLDNYKKKIKELKKQYTEEQKKMKNKAEIYWLVSAQCYLG